MIISYSNIQQLLPMIIEGKVVNDTNIPLGGAKVYFVPRIEETVTSDNGEFKLSTWMSLPLTLIVCHKNYESHKITLSQTPQHLVIKLKQQ